MAEKWIQHAIKHKGAATAKAKAEGLPVHEWAAKHQHDKNLTGKQARLALTLHHLSQTEESGKDNDADEAGEAKPKTNAGMGSFY
jgi:hypothetical protein